MKKLMCAVVLFAVMVWVSTSWAHSTSWAQKVINGCKIQPKTSCVGKDLKNANLTNARLLGANLTEANLSNANLTNANLHSANLSKANLSKAKLHSANLTNANLRGAFWTNGKKCKSGSVGKCIQ